MTSESPEPAPPALAEPLPEPVRLRVLALAAEALGALTPEEVPAALRGVARFTPAKRAKAGGGQLAAALEADPVFRQRVAERVRLQLPDLAAAVAVGEPPPAADPQELAAVAYLLRPDGWTKLVDTAAAAIERAARTTGREQAEQAVRRLQEQLATSQAEGRGELERLRADLVSARAELGDVRRRLREAEVATRRAETAAAAAELAAEEARAQALAQVAGTDSERRRLRSRLAEAEGALEAGRRATREGRSVADVRLRLLLDTVLDAAQGLRRELALPPVGSRPADAVGGVAPGGVSVGDLVARARPDDDPATLDELLALPQSHLVVDGYNVTKSGFPALTLEEQRARLVAGLAVLAAQTGAEVTCVFDGAALEGPVPGMSTRGVRVLFSAPGETADELIRRLVAAEPGGRPVVVVSSDREVADGVRRSGARPVPAASLVRRLGRV